MNVKYYKDELIDEVIAAAAKFVQATAVEPNLIIMDKEIAEDTLDEGYRCCGGALLIYRDDANEEATTVCMECRKRRTIPFEEMD